MWKAIRSYSSCGPLYFFIGSYNAATSTVGTGDWYKDMEGGRVPIHGHLWHRQMPYRHFQTTTPLPSESSHGRFSPNTKIHANHPVISLLYLTKPEHVFLILERETYKVDGCPTTPYYNLHRFLSCCDPKYHLPYIRTCRSASLMSRCKVRGENHGN